MAEKEVGEKGSVCCCPMCDAEVTGETTPWCQACGVTLRRCSNCLVVVEKEATVCSGCGQALN